MATDGVLVGKWVPPVASWKSDDGREGGGGVSDLTSERVGGEQATREAGCSGEGKWGEGNGGGATRGRAGIAGGARRLEGKGCEG